MANNTKKDCPSCDGKGFRPCTLCGRFGLITLPYITFPCPNCGGNGYKTCPTCKGSGKVPTK